MERRLHPDPTFNPTSSIEIARDKSKTISSSENRHRDIADLQTEVEGHERKIDPTRNPTLSAQTRNALGQDDAISC